MNTKEAYPKQVVKFTILSLALLFLFSGYAQQSDPLQTADSEAQKIWVDSLMQQMSLRQKIGQLFMVDAYSNKDKKHEEHIKQLISKYEIGGLIFMQGTPNKQIKLNNLYQSNSKMPLLIGFDGEWGLDMRLDSTYKYPWNMSLGAIRNSALLEELGKRIGEQHRRMGIHVNFAPVVDINTNPNNPIIGNRSYGENKYNVTQKAVAFTKGLQAFGVLACGKHFPGHGDTDGDSHKTLPSVLFDSIRIDSVELYPYKELIKANLASVMTAHLSIPALEQDSLIPTSISKNVITDLLQNQLNFKGLIFTDALNMKGASNFAKPGEIDLAAFLAGNDVLLFSEDIPKAIDVIEAAFNAKKFSKERLEYSVRKILKAKYWAGLSHYKAVNAHQINVDLNSPTDEVLHRKLIDHSVTLLKRSEVYPVKDVQQKIAYIKLGDADNADFISMLQNYAPINTIKSSDPELLKKLKTFDLVIIGYHKSNAHPWKSFSFKTDELKLLDKIANNNKVILSVFTSPYSLLEISDFSTIKSVILSYQNSKIAQELTAQKIFGALETKGKVPVSIGRHFPEGYGLFSHKLKRLSYGIPEEVGINSSQLERIDSIANEVLTQEMAPSMQVLVARHGKIIYHKAFGHFTFDKKIKIKKTDAYDLASITKILGALPLVMKAEEEGKFDLDDPLGKIMPILKGTNKDTITIKEALSHKSRLKAWIPYYVNTLDSITKKPLATYYSTTSSKDFRIKIAEKLYLRSDYQDTIYQRIADSDLRESLGYKYSGLLFYLYKDYFKTTYNQEMDVLVQEQFYNPIGANSLTYNPLKKYAKEQIVPTEKDDYYRNRLLQGTVHDMGAAMMNGISGNAGLFGNANDVAKMMQMYLQGGFYGGKRYLYSKTIDKFNKRYYEKDSIRRGLGFDKPQLKPEVLATCGCVSDKSFGHSGFTGTYTWADPETGLLYVFLSNRVYPTMANTKLVKEDIRTKTQQIIVDAIVE